MIKCLSFIIILLLIQTGIPAQAQNIDSLKQIIHQQKGDTSEVKALYSLAYKGQDSALPYIQRALVLAQKLKYKRGEADCFLIKGSIMYYKNVTETIQNAINALKIYEELNYIPGIIAAHGALQGSYREIADYKNALSHAFEGLRIAKVNNSDEGIFFMQGQKIAAALEAEIAQTYLLMNKIDSAEHYAEQAINERQLFNGAQWNFPVYLMATIQNIRGNYKAALDEYRYTIPLAIQNEIFRDTLQIFSGMSTAFRNLGQLDSSLYYASLVEQSKNPEREIKTFLEALNNLAIGYKLKGKKDSAIKYIELNHTVRDSIFGNEKERIIQGITFSEKLKQQEIISAQAKYKSRLQIYALLAGLLVLLLITGILSRNNKQKQKAKNKIEKAYSELKATQAQLIQSEKMASLGELTAGIAHEIQNPLNFVNNFSEVSNELLDEMMEQLAVIASGAKQGNGQQVMGIANDLKQNLEKINHHGKRAEAIVKGMLQHSGTSSGQKDPTDINNLCDEYLRLAYHGLRAQDKSFNASTETDFDKDIGKINVVPQDMGRVMLNLINNAFYAVNEKAKLLSAPGAYEPRVAVCTKRLSDKIEIIVTDNGDGIPQNLIDKIFQPFFTTKPTGQGTGLGLSLAYDIVKSHGGEIKVETEEGKGSSFIFTLPVTQ